MAARKAALSRGEYHRPLGRRGTFSHLWASVAQESAASMPWGPGAPVPQPLPPNIPKAPSTCTPGALLGASALAAFRDGIKGARIHVAGLDAYDRPVIDGGERRGAHPSLRIHGHAHLTRSRPNPTKASALSPRSHGLPLADHHRERGCPGTILGFSTTSQPARPLINACRAAARAEKLAAVAQVDKAAGGLRRQLEIICRSQRKATFSREWH